jgi:hypothetical protein
VTAAAPSSGQLCKAPNQVDGWQAAASSSTSSSADEQLVLQLLQELPQLELLQLKQCSYLQQGGWVLAGQCCGTDSGAAVVVSKH